MNDYLIPCQYCEKMLPKHRLWFICDRCGFRVCPHCLSDHRGRYGRGFRCSRCQFGKMEKTEL